MLRGILRMHCYSNLAAHVWHFFFLFFSWIHDFEQLQLDYRYMQQLLVLLLSMISKQTSMAARAPILRRRICSSCISSQLAPENPVVHRHLYLSLVSLLTQDPPLRHGLSKHSFRSSHPLPSGVTRWPRGHLNSTWVSRQEMVNMWHESGYVTFLHCNGGGVRKIY